MTQFFKHTSSLFPNVLESSKYVRWKCVYSEGGGNLSCELPFFQEDIITLLKDVLGVCSSHGLNDGKDFDALLSCFLF